MLQATCAFGSFIRHVLRTSKPTPKPPGPSSCRNSSWLSGSFCTEARTAASSSTTASDPENVRRRLPAAEALLATRKRVVVMLPASNFVKEVGKCRTAAWTPSASTSSAPTASVPIVKPKKAEVQACRCTTASS